MIKTNNGFDIYFPKENTFRVNNRILFLKYK